MTPERGCEIPHPTVVHWASTTQRMGHTILHNNAAHSNTTIPPPTCRIHPQIYPNTRSSTATTWASRTTNPHPCCVKGKQRGARPTRHSGASQGWDSSGIHLQPALTNTCNWNHTTPRWTKRAVPSLDPWTGRCSRSMASSSTVHCCGKACLSTSAKSHSTARDKIQTRNHHSRHC